MNQPGGLNKPNVPFSRVIVPLIAFTLVILVIRIATSGDAPTPTPTLAPTLHPTHQTDSSAPPTQAGPPDCHRADVPTAYVSPDDWGRELVDPTLSLPPDYVPPDLASVTQAGFVGDAQVRDFVIRDLKKLRKAAAASGVDLGIVVGYRSYADQTTLFNERVALGGRDAALAHTARPGHSEHQLGTTIDFRTADQSDVSSSWGSEPEGIWMEEHAWEYGFILSYPRNMEASTCYDYEPWHFRYMGRPEAKQIHESGLTLREWLWGQQDQSNAGGASESPSP